MNRNRDKLRRFVSKATITMVSCVTIVVSLVVMSPASVFAGEVRVCNTGNHEFRIAAVTWAYGTSMFSSNLDSSGWRPALPGGCEDFRNYGKIWLGFQTTNIHGQTGAFLLSNASLRNKLVSEALGLKPSSRRKKEFCVHALDSFTLDNLSYDDMAGNCPPGYHLMPFAIEADTSDDVKGTESIYNVSIAADSEVIAYAPKLSDKNHNALQPPLKVGGEGVNKAKLIDGKAILSRAKGGPWVYETGKVVPYNFDIYPFITSSVIAEENKKYLQNLNAGLLRQLFDDSNKTECKYGNIWFTPLSYLFSREGVVKVIYVARLGDHKIIPIVSGANLWALDVDNVRMEQFSQCVSISIQCANQKECVASVSSGDLLSANLDMNNRSNVLEFVASGETEAERFISDIRQVKKMFPSSWSYVSASN